MFPILCGIAFIFPFSLSPLTTRVACLSLKRNSPKSFEYLSAHASWNMGRWSGVLLAVACADVLVTAQYRRGDGVALECALDPPRLGDSPQISWKPFPVCFETDLPLEVRPCACMRVRSSHAH